MPFIVVIGISTLFVIGVSLVAVLVPTRNQSIASENTCPISAVCLPTSYPELFVGNMSVTGILIIVNNSLGLITSMDMNVPPDIFHVTSPVFVSGPAVLSFASSPQQSHTFWGGAVTSVASAPTFRSITATDLPVVPIDRGGTNNNASLVGNRAMLSDDVHIYESPDTLFDGFLITGRTGGPPVSAALVPGNGVEIAGGPGSISISATGACSNGTKMSQSCIDISNMQCAGGALDPNCIPGSLSFDTLYVNNLVAINSTQQTIISANASVLQVERLVADRVQLSGDFECIAGSGNIASDCYDISGKTCTVPVDNTCLPLRIGTINGIAPESSTYDFGIVSGGAGLSVTPTTNGVVIANTGVTSVALSLPASLMSVTGSPVTTTGTLTGNLVTQLKNTVFAGPAAGAPASPSFRSQVLADLPQLSDGQLYVGSTGAPVVATTITAGSGIAVTNGAGSVTVALADVCGTVTSVGLSMPSIFSVSGSPITTSGTLSASLATQSAGTFLAGPATGGSAVPTFRALQISDISTALSRRYNTITGSSGFSSTSYTVITGATPPAGEYFVWFSGTVEPTASPCEFAIAICKSLVPEEFSIRYMTDQSGRFVVSTQSLVTVNGSEQVTACWAKISGSCTYSMFYATVTQLRVSP